MSEQNSQPNQPNVKAGPKTSTKKPIGTSSLSQCAALAVDRSNAAEAGFWVAVVGSMERYVFAERSRIMMIGGFRDGVVRICGIAWLRYVSLMM